MSAASPGVVAVFFRNDHYPIEEATSSPSPMPCGRVRGGRQSGLVLQIDCPDLAMGRHIKYRDLDLETFREGARAQHRGAEPCGRERAAEQLRMHVCWGNYEGPHHCDVPLADVIDIVFKAKPSAISFEAANPRHAHEWTLSRP